MQLGIESQIPDGLLAANALLAENSRQGVPTLTNTLHRGFQFAIFSTYMSLQFRCSESASDPVDAPSNNGFPKGTVQAISTSCAAAANSIGTAHNWAVSDGAIATALFTGAGLSPAGKVFGKILGEVGLIFGTTAGVEGTYAYFGGKLYSTAGCPSAPPVP
jgi:hypothetical protein